MGDENTKGITTVNGGSPKLGPGSNIHGEQCWPGPQGVQGIASKFWRCVVVGNKAYEPLIEGNVYLVYRKHEQTGEPTYSLCTYENGNWIPYGIIEAIKKLPWFVGIPVTDDDLWICVTTAFADDEASNAEVESPVEDPGNETVQDFVKRRREEIEKEECEQRQKAEKERMEREMRGEIVPHCMPITPGYPNPNPSVPGYPYPFGPIITYSVPGQGPVCSFTPAPSTEFNITGKK